MIEALSMVAAMVLEAQAPEGPEGPEGKGKVVKNGEVFEGSTLDRVWPSEKKLPPLSWWTSSPNSLGGGRD